MQARTAATALAALCLAPALGAWMTAPTLTLQPQSRLWVNGTSTVRAFECGAKTFETRIDAAGADVATAVMTGAKAVRTATLTVPAAELDCRNGTMNEHMLKALKAKDHPTIEFRVASYELSAAPAGKLGTATGELRLGGVTKPVTVTGTVTQEPDGALRIVGSTPLKMTDYGLKAPTLMMGTMKVNPQVKVGFDLRLKG